MFRPCRSSDWTDSVQTRTGPLQRNGHSCSQLCVTVYVCRVAYTSCTLVSHRIPLDSQLQWAPPRRVASTDVDVQGSIAKLGGIVLAEMLRLVTCVATCGLLLVLPSPATCQTTTPCTGNAVACATFQDTEADCTSQPREPVQALPLPLSSCLPPAPVCHPFATRLPPAPPVRVLATSLAGRGKGKQQSALAR